MYVNYGNKNFYERGILVNQHSDTEFTVLFCAPYDDEEDKYLFAKLDVDICSDFIDQDKICKCAKLDCPEDDPIKFALCAIDYYGVEYFGPEDNAYFFEGGKAYPYYYDYQNVNKETVKKILEYEYVSEDIINSDIC